MAFGYNFSNYHESQQTKFRAFSYSKCAKAMP